MSQLGKLWSWFDSLIMPLLTVAVDESGATAIEYALIAVLISIAALTVISTVGTNVSNTFNCVAGYL
jgi:pilus assembly protein Flp/PilA